MTEEYIYTGRLWVLPFSRQYEFHRDGQRYHLIWGDIDETYITTEQLEQLVPGRCYMCEFEEEPSWLAGDIAPKLLYVRNADGGPFSADVINLYQRVNDIETRLGVLEEDKRKTTEASKRLMKQLEQAKKEMEG